mgnify:CR=1 FL=1
MSSDNLTAGMPPEAAVLVASVAAAAGAAAPAAGPQGAALALAAYQEALAQRPLVGVRFSLRLAAGEGQRVRVVGGHEELGERGWGACGCMLGGPRLAGFHAHVWVVLAAAASAAAAAAARIPDHYIGPSLPHPLPARRLLQATGLWRLRQSCAAAAATRGRSTCSCPQVRSWGLTWTARQTQPGGVHVGQPTGPPHLRRAVHQMQHDVYGWSAGSCRLCLPLHPSASGLHRSALLHLYSSPHLQSTPCMCVCRAGCIVEYKYVMLDASGRNVVAWQASAALGGVPGRPGGSPCRPCAARRQLPPSLRLSQPHSPSIPPFTCCTPLPCCQPCNQSMNQY